MGGAFQLNINLTLGEYQITSPHLTVIHSHSNSIKKNQDFGWSCKCSCRHGPAKIKMRDCSLSLRRWLQATVVWLQPEEGMGQNIHTQQTNKQLLQFSRSNSADKAHIFFSQGELKTNLFMTAFMNCQANVCQSLSAQN